MELRYTRIINNNEVFTYFFIFDSGSSSNLGRSCVSSFTEPYPETSSTTSHTKKFNYRQSRARIVVENAFGRLKGRWRCLQKRLDFKLANVPNIVGACVVMHFICE